jgi:hypothetical protein
MNTKVQVRGSLLTPPVQLNALLANNCPLTTISKRLAKKLGLSELRDVLITDALGGCGVIRWNLSVLPMVVTASCMHKPAVCYPVVNGQEEDAFWEMIIGQDVWRDQAIELMNNYDRAARPSPGPAFQVGVGYMGHNIRMVSLKELDEHTNTFLEYSALKSSSTSRIALNKATHELITVDRESGTISCYADLTSAHQSNLEACEEDIDENMLADIRRSCPHSVIEEFPDSVLVSFPTAVFEH